MFREDKGSTARSITIKLLIDTNTNKVLFAEASKDFVDFLKFLLSLPMGTVTNLVTSKSMVGSIGNIYSGVEHLGETAQNAILNPTRSNPKCGRGIMDAFINQENTAIDKDEPEGYVQNTASYMISDDLSITSLSTMSVVSMINKYNGYKLGEKEVKIGNKGALELLKSSLRSTTVLTDVFLTQQGNGRGDTMQILVKNLKGKTITIMVEPYDTIAKVKALVEAKEGIPAKVQRLLYRSSDLKDDRTVADYNNFEHASTLELSLRLLGC